MAVIKYLPLCPLYVPFGYLFRAYARKGTPAIIELYQKEVGAAASARLARISPLDRLGNARRSEMRILFTSPLSTVHW